jgi:DNA-binding Lrp family transcriptional regulator
LTFLDFLNDYLERIIVFLTVEREAGLDVVTKLRLVKYVKEAHLINGPYKVYFEAEADTLDELASLVTDEIWKIKGIKSYMSCFIAD